MLTACSFLAPVTVVSAVSPMVAKLRLDRLEDTGTVVGGLSAAGTVGALAATFLTGFVLVAALPSRPVVWLVGATLIVMGVVLAWRLGRRRPTTIEVAVVALVGVGSALVAPVCDFETAYFCVRIETDRSGPTAGASISTTCVTPTSTSTTRPSSRAATSACSPTCSPTRPTAR